MQNSQLGLLEDENSVEEVIQRPVKQKKKMKPRRRTFVRPKSSSSRNALSHQAPAVVEVEDESESSDEHIEAEMMPNRDVGIGGNDRNIASQKEDQTESDQSGLVEVEVDDGGVDFSLGQGDQQEKGESCAGSYDEP